MKNKTVDELLDDFIDEVTASYDGQEPEQFLRDSLNKILTKRKQGTGIIVRESVQFCVEDEMSLPIFPQQYEDEEWFTYY